MNVVSVDVETNDKLKKAKLENGFYRVKTGDLFEPDKTLSIARSFAFISRYFAFCAG
jgi:hypothetical protein